MNDNEKFLLAIKKTIEELPTSKPKDELLNEINDLTTRITLDHPDFESIFLGIFKHRIEFLIKRNNIIEQRKTDEIIKRLRTIEVIMIAFAAVSVLVVLIYLFLLM